MICIKSMGYYIFIYKLVSNDFQFYEIKFEIKILSSKNDKNSNKFQKHKIHIYESLRLIPNNYIIIYLIFFLIILQIYTDCTCIRAPPMNLTTADSVISYEAINTTCSTSCSYLWPFIALAFCNMFITFLCTMPALSATLRVVRDDQRSFALGIQWIKVRILGTIPAPMVFGALIDETCILWNKTCDGEGSCLVYDNLYMSR